MIRRRRSRTAQAPPLAALTFVMMLGAGGLAVAQAPTTTPAGEEPAVAGAAGETTPAAEPTLESIRRQIEALQEQLLVLQRQAELAERAAAEQAAAAKAATEAAASRTAAGAGVTASPKDGFSVRSDDGDFTLKVRGYIHVDGRGYLGDRDDRAVDSWLLRRARPIFEGTLYERFGYRLMADFGSGATLLQDVYVEWTFGPGAIVRAGKFKAPFGLERLQSATETAFVERAFPAGLGPNRDAGIQLSGELAGGKLEYAAGVFNGVADGASGDTDVNDDKDVVARVLVSPWQGTPSGLSGLTIGLAGTGGNQQGTPTASGLAGYRTVGQQSPASGSFFGYRADGTAAGTTIADGRRFRLSPQASFFAGPFGFLGEYVQSRHAVRRGASAAELTHRAWQATGIWVLTGENASYRWHVPERGLDPTESDPERRGWGGFTLVGRYNAFRADADSFPTFAAASAVQEASGWALGLDWTLQRQIRLLLDYEVTSFGGRGTPRRDEKVWFTRFQLAW
jgi:phosphate-selective porin OprO/OprP